MRDAPLIVSVQCKSRPRCGLRVLCALHGVLSTQRFVWGTSCTVEDFLCYSRERAVCVGLSRCFLPVST